MVAGLIVRCSASSAGRLNRYDEHFSAMTSAPAQELSKFSKGFPVDFVKENVGVIVYYTFMIALFELFMIRQLSQVLGGSMRVIYLYSAHLNIKSRASKYLTAHGSYSGDQAVLRAFGSALMAAAGLSLYFTIEDYLSR